MTVQAPEALIAAQDTNVVRESRVVPRKKFNWIIYLPLLPLVVTIGLFAYYPAVSGVFHSFFDWNPSGESPFVGLANYVEMMHDDLWLRSFGNLGLVFVFSIGGWLFPLISAELLLSLRSQRTAFVFRTLLIVPMAFPGVVTALIWTFIYDPNHGALNQMLDGLGLGFLAQNWVGDPSIAMLSLLFIGFPFIAGLPFLVIYSALQNVPPEIFEAAELDGVGRVRRVFTIDIPLMAGQFRLLLFLAVISTLQYGFAAYVVTNGGPDNATIVPVLRMINEAFKGGNWGYAAALSTTLFALTLIFSCIVAFARRRGNSISDAKGM